MNLAVALYVEMGVRRPCKSMSVDLAAAGVFRRVCIFAVVLCMCVGMGLARGLVRPCCMGVELPVALCFGIA